MKFLWLGLLLILVVLGASSYFWLESSLKPASADPALRTFSIEIGDPGSTILRKLAAAHLIRSYYAARIYYLLSDKQTNFRPGIYYLPANKSVSDLFRQLQKGPKDIKVTFHEGWRKEQYAARLANLFPNFDTNSFLNLSATLEGQLFPDTYYLPASPSPQKVISVLTANYAKKTASLNLTSDQLIVASLVEREANNASDSALVAGIIFKRLQKNWPLQIDATVQYAADSRNCQSSPLTCHYWQPIYDTTLPSVYNTYLHPGLPPAPISNPGLRSLNAVLNPQNSDYWYYLTDKQGITHFSKDLRSHELLIDSLLKS